MADLVLAIDPGRMKCGVAVVRRSPDMASYETAWCSVIETSALAGTIRDLVTAYSPDVTIVGDGTTSSQATKIAKDLEVGLVEVVDEKFTTLLAQKRFFQENPPKGLRRLIPTSLQTPDHPCDGYVAVILAERYLDSSR